MPWRRRAWNQRGFTLAELVLATAIGVIVLLGAFSMYRGTTTAFNQSSSQAAVQRQGTLAMQAIQRQALRATSIVVQAAPGCAPAGTTGRALLITVNDTRHPSIPASEIGFYCYSAGTGADAGALCQRFSPSVLTTNVQGCHDLLGGVRGALIRQTGDTRIRLITQAAANPPCPRHVTDTAGGVVSGGQAIPNTQSCLALGQIGGNTAEVGFAISDGLNNIVFNGSLMLRN